MLGLQARPRRTAPPGLFAQRGEDCHDESHRDHEHERGPLEASEPIRCAQCDVETARRENDGERDQYRRCGFGPSGTS